MCVGRAQQKTSGFSHAYPTAPPLSRTPPRRGPFPLRQFLDPKDYYSKKFFAIPLKVLYIRQSSGHLVARPHEPEWTKMLITCGVRTGLLSWQPL